MKKAFLLVALLLPVIGFSMSNTTYQCVNDKTLLITTSYDDGSQSFVEKNCSIGCSKGRCVDAGDFSMPVFVGSSMIAVGVCLFFLLRRISFKIYRYVFLVSLLLLAAVPIVVVLTLGGSLEVTVSNEVLWFLIGLSLLVAALLFVEFVVEWLSYLRVKRGGWG